MKLVARSFALLTCVLSFAAQCSAVNIVVDYTHDTFFASHLAAKAALEAAAADISSAITTTLNATVDTNSSTVNGSSMTFDFQYFYNNPATDGREVISSAVMPQNEIRLFAGVRNMAANVAGEGGPASAGYTASGTSANFSDFVTAVNNAAAAGNANMLRGGGPILVTVPTSLTIPGHGSVPVSISFGSAAGNLSFDVDSNNDGVMDDDTTLGHYWHFNHMTDVATGKNDFYTVALHEILHSLGFGIGQSWDNKVTGGNDWTGPEVIAHVGSGMDILDGGSRHIVDGKLSPRVSDGVLQEAVMDPTITTGTRKQLTNLDLAFLRDIGWQTIDYYTAAPTGDFDGDGDVDGADFVVWQTNFPTTTGAAINNGDADGDQDVDGADFAIWTQQFAPSAPPGTVPVPEPPAGLLTILGGLLCTLAIAPRPVDGAVTS